MKDATLLGVLWAPGYFICSATLVSVILQRTNCVVNIFYKDFVFIFMGELNKELIAQNLRIIMAKLLISTEELANKTALSKHQINSILYCRTLKLENLEKIAAALNVQLEQLLFDGTEEYKTRECFDPQIYSEIMLAINNVLSFYHLQTNQMTIEKIANLAYKNYSEIKNLEETIRGMVLILETTSLDIIKIKSKT